VRITLFGAAGEVGRRISAEALARGHELRAVVRKPAQRSTLVEGVEACVGDASQLEDVVRLSQGQDLVISAVRPPEGNESLLVNLTDTILQAADKVGVRVLIVGGAAKLLVPGQGGHTVLSAPNFLPASVVPIATACFQQYELCRDKNLGNWTYLCPPAMLTPGVRTGNYRLGGDELVVDEQGLSQISMEDFAVAMLDESERVRHQGASFTAAY
jgi:putative NADH-flavin reductase